MQSLNNVSVKLMGAVWALDLPSTEKFVLLALADNANDDGTCWPSVSTISSKTSLAERTVRGVIHRLQRTGYVSITERHGRSHVFVVATRATDALPLHDVHPCTTCTPAPDAPTPASSAPPPLHHVHPTPAFDGMHKRTIKEPSSEPSRNRHQSDALRAEGAGTGKLIAIGTRIPEPFEVSAEMAEWAAKKTPGIDIAAVTEEFVDYWKAVPGQRGRKTDWVATWRNRMRDKSGRKAAADAPRKTRFAQLTEKLKAQINAD